MRAATLRLLAAPLTVGVLVSSVGTPLEARATGPFDYKMEVTAEEGPVDPNINRRHTGEFSQCQNRAKITSDNAACFEAEFRRQDAKLNEAWRTTLNRTAPEARRPLLDAERKWIADRDPFCMKNADGFSGGTIVPIVYVSCRVELTIRRTIWLEAFGAPAPVASPTANAPSAALKAFLKTYVRGATIDHTSETRYAVAWKDLNGDGRPEAIVYLMGDGWCGSGGCSLLVLEQSGGGFTVRGETAVTQAPIAVLPSTSHGWRDLVVGVGGGGGRSGQVVLPFQGEHYAHNPTVPPAHRLGRSVAAEVLIKAEDRGENL